jgi:uncharacterized phage protein gp47/JayE
MGYVVVPIETDPDALSQDAFDYMAEKTGGAWEPHDGQLDTWQLEANARMAATLRDTASDVRDSIFRYFGTLVNVLPEDSVSATTTLTVGLTDAAGHTIPAGTAFGLQDDFGNMIAFESTVEVIVPAGEASGQVPIAAIEDGSAASGLGAGGTQMVILDSIAWINTATMNAPTAGGVDAEEDSDYLNRLSDNLKLMTPRPILPGDFSILARNVPGVYRALALDGYNPGDNSNGNARMITVSVVDIDGNNLSATVKDTVLNNLRSARETTFQVFVIDPTVTIIDILFDATTWPDVDPVEIKASIIAALQNYVNKARWGNPSYGDVPSWYIHQNVKANDLIGVVKSVDGVRDVNSVTIRTGAGAYSAADIVLPGAAPLAHYGTVDGAVA